jgi:hypothetical protein
MRRVLGPSCGSRGKKCGTWEAEFAGSKGQASEAPGTRRMLNFQQPGSDQSSTLEQL